MGGADGAVSLRVRQGERLPLLARDPLGQHVVEVVVLERLARQLGLVEAVLSAVVVFAGEVQLLVLCQEHARVRMVVATLQLLRAANLPLAAQRRLSLGIHADICGLLTHLPLRHGRFSFC